MIYGGSTTRTLLHSVPVGVIFEDTFSAYDLKIIMNKDIHDVIKPEWVRDCVARGRLLPLHKR